MQFILHTLRKAGKILIKIILLFISARTAEHYLFIIGIHPELLSFFHSRGQRAKRTCLHVHLATAARVRYPVACCGVFDLYIRIKAAHRHFPRVNLRDGSVLLPHQKLTPLVDAKRNALKRRLRVQHTHLAVSVRQYFIICVLKPGKISRLHEHLIIPRKCFHHGTDHLRPFYRMSRLDPKRGRDLFQCFRNFRLVHIDPGSDHHIIDIIDLGAHLRQDPAEFMAVQHRIVGPLDLNRHIQQFLQSLRHAQPHNDRQHGSPHRFQIRPQDQRHAHRGPSRRFPASAAPSPALGLFIGNDQRSVRRAFLRQPFAPGIGGIHFLREIYPVADPFPFQPALNLALAEDIRHF